MVRLLLGILISTSMTGAPLLGVRTSPSDIASRVSSPNLALYHDGWDSFYRIPFGAAPTASHVTLRLRSARSVTNASLSLVASNGFVKAYAMRLQKHDTTSDFWAVTVTMPSKPTNLSYYFRAKAGATVRWYGDNNSVGDSGAGRTYSKEANVLDYELTVYLKSFHAPAWMIKAIVYQIFPDRFYNGDPSNDPVSGTRYGYITVHFHKNWADLPDQPSCGCDFFGGDLQGVIDKLPYLHRLGVNVVYLNPIFLAPSNHKYDTSNFMEIDPEFGTLRTLQALIAGMRKLGMHLILDGVFEDTGSDSVYFNKYGNFPGAGAYQSKSSPYFPWYTFRNWPQEYSDWSGVDSLPLLRDTTAVEDFIFRKPNSVAQYWLRQGASGWRLDSANSLSDAYWRSFRTGIKAAFPNSVIIGEYWQNALPWLTGNEWDGVINYQFREPVLDFFAHGAGAQNPTHINATDFLATEMGLLAQYPRPAIASSMNIVDSHDTTRILTDLAGNTRALELVALCQMTWPGAPTVYYGDEAGLRGYSDPDDRRTFPWSHQNTSLEAYYARAIHLRLSHSALSQGSVVPLLALNTARVVAYLRERGTRKILVVLNDSNGSQTVTIRLPQFANGTRLRDLLGGSHGALSVRNGALRVVVPKLSGRVLG